MPAKVNVSKGKTEKINASAKPKNWPKDVQFLTDQTYSAAVPADLRDALARPISANDPYSKVTADALNVPCSLVEIRMIDDEEHPAHGQRGLFAAQHLGPDTFICLYLGHVHTNSLSDTDPHSDYDLSLDRELGLSVDAARSGNEARFANDYRSIAERPNAEFRDCLISVKSEKRADGSKWERRVGIFVLSAGKAGKRKAGIKSGEEITVTYGKGYWESRKLMATFRKDFEMLKIANAALKSEYSSSKTSSLQDDLAHASYSLPTSLEASHKMQTLTSLLADDLHLTSRAESEALQDVE